MTDATPTPPLHPADPDVARAMESFQLRDAMIAGLAASAQDLAEVARSLYKTAVLSRVERTVIVLLLLGLTISSVASLVGVVRLSNVANVNKENGRYVRECTTPGTEKEPHPCFDDSQKRTAALIGQLNRATIIAVACGNINATEAAITKCVTDRLAVGTKSGG